MNQFLVRWMSAGRTAAADRLHDGDDLTPAGSRQEVVTIALGFDRNYAPHAAAVLSSIAAGAPGGRFRFIMLHIDIAEATKRTLERIVPGAEFVWREVDDEDLPAFETRAHLTRATLFRLGLEKLAPADCHRVIYLDVDLIVMGDIRRLWRAELGVAALGAVADDTIDAGDFAARWGQPAGPGYFNAGVLVIDLDRVRQAGLFSAAIEFLARHDRDLPFCDQDALNWACWGRWRLVDAVWNVQRTSAIDYALGAHDRFTGNPPRIVHYTGPDKPWARAGYHPWHWLYWEALARTELFEVVAANAGLGLARLLKLWVRWRRNQPRAARAGRAGGLPEGRLALSS